MRAWIVTAVPSQAQEKAKLAGQARKGSIDPKTHQQKQTNVPSTKYRVTGQRVRAFVGPNSDVLAQAYADSLRAENPDLIVSIRRWRPKLAR